MGPRLEIRAVGHQQSLEKNFNARLDEKDNLFKGGPVIDERHCANAGEDEIFDDFGP